MPMRPSRKKNIALLSAIVSTLVLCLFFFAAGFRTSSARQEKERLKDRPPIPELPVVDYELSAHPGGVSTSSRRERDSRYDNKDWVREDANVSIVAIAGHWGLRMASLPVGESDDVVLGRVIQAQAHLSRDKTGIYSEFTFEIESVYKESSSISLYAGSTIAIAREGGAVRFPSGRIQRYIIAHQGMPRVGERYVLFLKNAQGESFDILTGYELRNNKVQPLDSLNTFAAYNQVAESEFLDALRDALKHVNQ